MNRVASIIGFLIIGGFCSCCSEAVFANDATSVCQWKGDKDGAVSITFDDTLLGQYTAAFPELKKRGLCATYFTIYSAVGWSANQINPPELRELADNGQEIASHTVNHLRLTVNPYNSLYVSSSDQQLYQVSQSKTLLEAIVDRPVDTIAYPGGVYDSSVVLVASSYYIAGRASTNASLNSSSPSNYQMYTLRCVPAHDAAFGSGDANAIACLEYWSNQAGSQRKWAIDMFHGIGSPASGDNVSTTAFSTYLDYLKANDHRLWIAPMGTVAKYIYERNAAQTYTVTDVNSTIVVDVNCYLDSRFNTPLTLITPCPDSWLTMPLAARQGQTILSVSHYAKGGYDYIMYDAVPDAGPVTLYFADPNGPSLSAAGNFDHNYTVDYGDLILFCQAWLAASQDPNWQTFVQCDLDSSDTVDMADFALMANNWMAYSPAAPPLIISGNAGMDGVTMSGLPGYPVTSGGGFYSAVVPAGWNGTVNPAKTGISFTPASRSFSQVTSSHSSQDFTAASIILMISGNAGMDGVTMNGLPGNPVTSGDGLYNAVVPYGWNGTIAPAKSGYYFSPKSVTYTDMTASLSNRNFAATQAPNCIISGSTGVDGVKMNGLPGNPITSGGGLYSVVVPYGWSGTITPTKRNYHFSPTSVSYTNVTSDMPNRNFGAAQWVANCTISGSADVDGVKMNGLPGGPMTSGGGFFSAVVSYGWSGTITPTKAGYSFSPASISYTGVTSDLTDRNFSATQSPTCTISGSTGVDDVNMVGLPGSPMTSGGGLFSAVVPYGWSGTITPIKAGYIFSPTSISYTNVTSDMNDRDFSATQITTCTISGSTGVDDVNMVGLPGSPMTSGGGLYSAAVPYGWNGTVTPTKTGFNFDPIGKSYTNVTADEPNQNYAALPQPLDSNMVFIPAGMFQMGDSRDVGNSDEKPVHTVTLSCFYMSKYDVTNQQYCDFLNSAAVKVVNGVVYASTDSGNAYLYCDTSTSTTYSQIDYSGGVFSVRTKSGRSMANDPMVCVSWYGAVAYCNWRSQQAGMEQCYNTTAWTCDFSKKGYRLPTEAQWEYAARGGLLDSIFPWGDTITHSQANYYSLSSYSYDISPTTHFHPTWSIGSIYPFTSPVGSFAANGYGLYDMAGNVAQWCNDGYGSYSSSPQTNPTGSTTGSNRVLRGGCWTYDARSCRAAYRINSQKAFRYFGFGFRVSI